MSDISQGEGWWQASDHKWYPPEQHPDLPGGAATRRTRSDLGLEKAVEIDFQSNGFHGQLFFVRTNATVVLFAFIALDTSDTSTVSEASSVVRHALDRLAS